MPINCCAYGDCANASVKFQLTEFLGGHRTRTKPYCSSTHLLLSVMGEIADSAGTKLHRVSMVTMGMVKKFTDAVEKEWAASAPKRPSE